MNNQYLKETPILNFSHPALQQLVEERNWKTLPLREQISAVYDFVQNEIEFGYNTADDIPASMVLKDGYGQCNTKGTLLMALLRSLGIAARFHGFSIDNELQKGAIQEVWLKLAPESIIHSWVEVLYEDRWVNLEGFILDKPYLKSVQAMFPNAQGEFCGFGIAVKDFKSPPIEWKGEDTYIQKEGINHDFGLFDSPDDFYRQYGSNLSGFKSLLYKYVLRHSINRNVRKIRNRAQGTISVERGKPSSDPSLP